MVVGDLLLFSHVYAGWPGLRRGRPRPGRRLDIGARHLSVLAAAVGLATFLVRLVFPFASERYVDLNWYQWPECVALFALGIMAAPSGWLTTVSEQLCGHSRTATLVAGRWDRGFRRLGSRLRRAPGGHVDGRLARRGADVRRAREHPGGVRALWLLGGAQRHLDRPLRWAGPAVGRSAYGAFIVQGVVLIGLAVALRPLPVAAEAKALVVAVGGVTGSFRVDLAAHHTRPREWRASCRPEPGSRDEYRRPTVTVEVTGDVPPEACAAHRGVGRRRARGGQSRMNAFVTRAEPRRLPSVPGREAVRPYTP